MKPLLALTLLALTLNSCSKETENINSELQGQWVLTKVVCFCFFEDYDFTQNQLWIFTDERKLLAKGPLTDEVNVAPLNNPTTFSLEDQRLEIEATKRSYTLDLQSDTLTLTYIDDPRIADDEVTYVFEKRSADTNCINLDQVNPNAVCTEEFMPVCGCDGITYSNRCTAETYGGVNSYSDGPCDN